MKAGPHRARRPFRWSRAAWIAVAWIAAALLALVMVARCDNVSPPMTRGELDRAVAVASALPFPGYYFGDRAGDYALDQIWLPDPTDRGVLQVDALYGPCQGSGLIGDDEGCTNPLGVNTQPWAPAPVDGGNCRRLEPRLGVPTAVLYGELTVFTGSLKVTLDDPDVKEGLSLLRTLRPMGGTAPVTSLPPPTQAIVSWVDQTCGSHPGDSGEAPQPTQTSGPNTSVPAFIVQRFGGGQMSWSQYAGRPVVVVVGDLVPVSRTTGRLADLVRGTSVPAIIGLVWDMKGDKMNPAPVEEVAARVPPFQVPVGYAALPAPAVWFYDSAANITGTTDYDSVVIAVVDAHGEVTRFLPALDPNSAARAVRGIVR